MKMSKNSKMKNLTLVKQKFNINLKKRITNQQSDDDSDQFS